MKVKIVKQTNTANHGLLEHGSIIDIDELTAKRWIKRGIARESIEEETDDEEEQEEEVTPLDELNFAELRQLAKSEGHENYGKMNAQQLRDLLTAPEPEGKDPFFDGEYEDS